MTYCNCSEIDTGGNVVHWCRGPREIFAETRVLNDELSREVSGIITKLRACLVEIERLHLHLRGVS